LSLTSWKVISKFVGPPFPHGIFSGCSRDSVSTIGAIGAIGDAGILFAMQFFSEVLEKRT
jgi:hypothetical protein